MKVTMTELQVHVSIGTGHVDISLFYCDLVHTHASFPKDDILYDETLDAS